MESIEELESFARERHRLNATLEVQRADLDKWLEQHVGQTQGLSMKALANLAVLVQARRNTLMELVKLDDTMLDRILQRRTDR